MSELTEDGNTAGGDNPVRGMGARDGDTVPNNWEERLAAARAKREKVLQSKGKAPAKPKIKPPVFVAEDAAADIGYKGVAAMTSPQEQFGLDEFDFVSRDEEPEKNAPLETSDQALFSEDDLPLGAVLSQDRPRVPADARSNPSEISKRVKEAVPGELPETVPGVGAVVAPRGGVSLSWVVTVVVACFFGVGVGMVLSFGAVVAMGWVSVNEIVLSPKQNEPTGGTEQPVVALSTGPADTAPADARALPAPPLVQSVLEAQFTTGSAISTHLDMSFPQVSAVVAKMRDAPALDLHTEQSDAELIIGSRGLVVASAPIAPPGSANNPSSPAILSAAISSPKRADTIDGWALDAILLRDTPPRIPEKSTVSLLTNLAVLENPALGGSVVAMAKVQDVVQTAVAAPALQATVPEIAWHVPEARRVRPDVLLAVAGGFEPKFYTDVALVEGPSDIAPPPAKAVSARAPVTQETRTALPAIDDASFYLERNLAAGLGLFGAERDRFRLVTFVPTNVSAERIAENAALLDTTGFPVDGVNRVDFRVSKTHVRYYREADAEVARAIAAEVGGTAKDFTTLRNRPPEGQVEIWLAGGRKFAASQSAKPRSNSNAAQREAALKRQLENRLVNSLRRGEHLKGLSE